MEAVYPVRSDRFRVVLCFYNGKPVEEALVMETSFDIMAVMAKRELQRIFPGAFYDIYKKTRKGDWVRNDALNNCADYGQTQASRDGSVYVPLTDTPRRREMSL